MRRRVLDALVTRHRPPRGDVALLRGDNRLLTAQLTAVRSVATVTAVRAAADLPAAQDAIETAITEAVI